jgi:hypothetical protein
MAKLALNMLRRAYEYTACLGAGNGEDPELLDITILVRARKLWEAENVHDLQV